MNTRYAPAGTRNVMLVIGAVATALLFTGCLFDPPPIQEENPPPVMDSPANVLKNVEIAYTQRNVDLYKSAMATNFVFFFDPNDVGQTPPGSKYVIPDSWTYTEDWQATKNMFEQAFSISLQIPTGPVGTPGSGVTKYKAENISISLLVMVDELNGFIANQGYCNFEFEKYTNTQGKDRWRLTKWWDFTGS